jgi:hypothetical protein
MENGPTFNCAKNRCNQAKVINQLISNKVEYAKQFIHAYILLID